MGFWIIEIFKSLSSQITPKQMKISLILFLSPSVKN